MLRQGTYEQIRFDLSQPVIAFSIIFLRRNTLSSESLRQNGCQSVPSELSCRVRSWRQPPDQHGAPCQLLLPVHGKACYMIPSVLRCHSVFWLVKWRLSTCCQGEPVFLTLKGPRVAEGHLPDHVDLCVILSVDFKQAYTLSANLRAPLTSLRLPNMCKHLYCNG